MAKGGEKETLEYHGGKQMTDLTSRPSDCPKRSLEGLRVLVVDDDPGVCQSVRDLLAEEGCSVLMAGGGLEALKILDRAAVDCIVSDVVMPDLDGYDLFMEVKRRGATPVLLMTAYYYDRDHVIKRSRLEGLEGGASGRRRGMGRRHSRARRRWPCRSGAYPRRRWCGCGGQPQLELPAVGFYDYPLCFDANQPTQPWDIGINPVQRVPTVGRLDDGKRVGVPDGHAREAISDRHAQRRPGR
jgi:CheY-like chemotaxis protein